VVRVLFTFTGGRGHVEPLVPIARAAGAAGHTVAFAGRPSILPAVEALGFGVFPTESARDEPPKRIPLRELDPEREERDFRDGFADRIARDRAGRVLALCGDWQPDVVVCEETDFGGMVAAERLGLPYASVVVIAAGSLARRELVVGPLNALRAERGLPPDPELAMLSRYLVLVPFPPSYRDPAFPLPATAQAFNPFQSKLARDDAAPPWLVDLNGAPTVYFTLGTVFNLESGDLFARVLMGLRDLPINVVVTVGPHIDPEELGPLPDSIHVERYVSQFFVLPRCSAVVSHGGSGTVVGALAHGLPQVVIPMGADQPLNAARCEELGAARVLDAIRATPGDVREAVSAVLSDPAYRSAAESLRDEIAALPGPAYAVTLLERLATERRPLLP
jgi:UDP:flavonoid glycosyltransferase YjiC (YdhE family)